MVFRRNMRVGNCLYPEWVVYKEHLPMRKESRIGKVDTMKLSSIHMNTDIVMRLIFTYITLWNKVALNFISKDSAFDNIFFTYIKTLILPDGHNYQTDSLIDSDFQCYYSLSLHT